MPLNEREQKILEEIERQFYQEDPKLAQTVAKTTLESVKRKWQRLAVVGFVVMVVSAGYLVMNRRRSKADTTRDFSLENWMDRVRQRWRRDG